MRGETIRDRSAVGRFPAVTLGSLEDVGGGEAQPKESGTQKAYGRWLRRLCPCCQPTADDGGKDALVTADDGHDKEGEVPAEEPEAGGGELEGTRS